MFFPSLSEEKNELCEYYLEYFAINLFQKNSNIPTEW